MCSVVIFCTLVFLGCKKEQPPATPPVKKAIAAPATPKPVLKPVSSALRLPPPPVNQFDFSSKKDPFKPYVVQVKPVSAQSVEQARKSLKDSLPIHSLDVSQFKLIGIVTGGKGNRAMVTDMSGKGYVLKVGMTIGRNNGKVVSITNDGVEVVEQFKDDNGRVRKENIKLTLPRKQ
ncbi:MAG: pilus assembly protein PilP [Desulfuromonadaceae bacterium]|nr:pilus assembly protein PilP [Desulfuromonadaceae bacterium]